MYHIFTMTNGKWIDIASRSTKALALMFINDERTSSNDKFAIKYMIG